MTFIRSLPGAAPSRRSNLSPSVSLWAGPRVAQLVALAHKLEARVRCGDGSDYLKLAELAHVSRARIAQIVILAQLAPDIQEYVLFLSAEYDGLISERELREIAREPLWDRQRPLFKDVLHRQRQA